jgi:hypothetical protein
MTYSIVKTFFLSILCLLFVQNSAKAHGYWLEVAGNNKINTAVKVQIMFGEYENKLREKGDKLTVMKDFKAYMIDPSGKKTEIALIQTETAFEGTFTPTQNGMYQIMAINDTREVQDWTKYGMGIVKPVEYLRQNYAVGAKAAAPSTPTMGIDAHVVVSGKTHTVSLVKNGQPYAKAKVVVTNPGGWEKNLIADAAGVVKFDATEPGMYLIETEYMDKTAGKYLDKEYAAIRNKFGFSVMIK